MTQTGQSEFQLRAAWNASLPANLQPTIHTSYTDDGSGGTVMHQVSFDPVTKKATSQDYKIAEPVSLFNGEDKPITAGNKLLVKQADGTYKDVAPHTADEIAAAKADTELKQSQIAKNYADAQKASSDSSSTNTTDAAGWVTNIKNGTAKFSDVPTALKTAVSTQLAANGSTNTDEMLKTTAQSLNELSTMVNQNKGFTAAVGFKGISSFFGIKSKPVEGSPAADFDAKLNQVKNDVIIPNLNLLHGLGRVTDREFQALTSAITDLSTAQSESAFKNSLNDITAKINAKTNPSSQSDSSAPAKGTDGSTFGFPGYHSDGTQWVKD